MVRNRQERLTIQVAAKVVLCQDQRLVLLPPSCCKSRYAFARATCISFSLVAVHMKAVVVFAKVASVAWKSQEDAKHDRISSGVTYRKQLYSIPSVSVQLYMDQHDSTAARRCGCVVVHGSPTLEGGLTPQSPYTLLDP